MSTALEGLLALLDLEQLELNLFRGHSPAEQRQRVFGGQVAAQALVATSRTVEDERPVHSLHAYFLRPGDPRVPIVFEVDRIRDGRSFTTRRTVAIQHGEVIFSLAASFQKHESGPEHSMPFPDVPAPEELPTYQDRMAPYAERYGKVFADWMLRELPIDSRPTQVPPWLDPTPRPPEQDVWIKTNGTLPDDPVLHQCVLAYASDLTLLDTAMLPHAVDARDNDYLMASLDHAMWFHRPFRVDEWLLYHQRSPSASNARGLAAGTVFTRDGAMVATVMQEGLIRTTPHVPKILPG